MERNPTALIVDDDRAIQRLLADALAKEGFTVLVEKDGEWALKTFEKKKVDVVLLDLLLPALHGFEVARRMRITPKGRRTPILFVSGVYKSSAHRKEAQDKYGIAEFIDKPINLGKLREALKAALGNAYPEAQREERRRAAIDEKPAESFADEGAREEVAAVEQAAKKSAIQTIKGDFVDKPFPHLLAELYRWRATGALLLRRDKIKKIVYFREGRPFSIKSNLLQECLGKLMIREKMISEGECEESISKMKQSGRQQGTVLIEMGCISPHNLNYALSLQLQTKLYDIFTWTGGDYQFNPKAEIPSDTNTLEMTTAQIIYEGVKRTYDDDRVRAALGPVESLFAHPARDPLLRFQEIGLDEEELSLLQSIDGHKTAGTLVALNLLPPLGTLQFLYAMRCSQMIDLKREAAEGPVEPKFMPRPFGPTHAPGPGETTEENQLPAGHALPPPLPPPPLFSGPPPMPFQVAPELPKASPRGPVPPVPTIPPPPPRGATSLLPELSGLFNTVSAEERDVRERLAATATSMKKMDYFQILGVAPNAPKDEIKRSYFGLAKEYHPDKHFGSYSAEVRNLAAEIFDLISTAHDTLTDEEERSRYVGELAAGVRKDVSDEVSKILAAEGKFQKGEELMRKKLYREAQQAFQEAVDLYDEEGEFHAYLGWSLFQSDPRSQELAERGIEHIETGIRLNPKVDKSYLFLGYIHKAIGRPDRAEKQFEKAIQCNPDCIEALRELRLLGKVKKK
ncbi:MAG TPA: response regulator [Myxococcales bacterium]